MLGGKCSTCARDFDDLKSEEASPRVLKCLHTFCAGCCQQFAQVYRGLGISCPQCECFTELDEIGIPGLQINFYELHLLELKRKEELQHKKFACDNCDSENAEWRCLQCDDGCANLCSSCKTQHGQMKALRNHQLISLEDFKNSTSYKLDVFPCPKHPTELLEVYCADCRHPVCLICAVYDHSTHIRKTLEDGLKIEASEANRLIDDVSHLFERYEEETESVQQVAERLESQHTALSNDIKFMFQNLHSELQRRLW